MTWKDLIRKLQNINMDDEVLVHNPETDEYFSVELKENREENDDRLFWNQMYLSIGRKHVQ